MLIYRATLTYSISVSRTKRLWLLCDLQSQSEIQLSSRQCNKRGGFSSPSKKMEFCFIPSKNNSDSWKKSKRINTVIFHNILHPKNVILERMHESIFFRAWNFNNYLLNKISPAERNIQHVIKLLMKNTALLWASLLLSSAKNIKPCSPFHCRSCKKNEPYFRGIFHFYV